VADWKTFEIQVPGKDLLEQVRSVLETLMVFLDILKAILDTIKIFLIDFGNPIRALVEALIKLIEELFLSLKATGAFAYFDVPDPVRDPNFDGIYGGYPAFATRFKASLFDTKDFNRPQPRPGSTKGGFVLLVVSATSVYAIIARIKQLLRFFGREFTSPRYAAPENVRAIPVGAKGDPILALAAVFSNPPRAIQVQWTLPTTVESPDPGFSDVVTRMAAEFIPPSYLIERSVNVSPASQKIKIGDLGSADVTGLVFYDRATEFSTGTPPEPVTRSQILTDEQQEPVIKFQKYILIQGTDVTNLIGQLGKFRWIDKDVKANQTYYYRVRALSGNLSVQNNQIVFPTSADGLTYTPEVRLGSGVMKWPGKDVVMGKPSGIVSTSLPDPTVGLGTFDPIATLKRFFQLAFSLDFQLPLPDYAKFNNDGTPAPNTLTLPNFVGMSSLMNVAGSVADFSSLAEIGPLYPVETTSQKYQPDPITGSAPEMPWQNKMVRKQAAKLTDIVVSTMLSLGGADQVVGLRNLMRGPFPRGTPNLKPAPNPSITNLEQMVYLLTDPNVDLTKVTRFLGAYTDVTVRLNVLVVVDYIKTFTLGGTPPDWISISPLRDIIPWSGQFIYDLLDKIQALLDAFSGTMTEIKNFIALLERKIDALERFIKFLLNILNFIESLELAVHILNVPSIDGSAQAWADAVDHAGGTPPPLDRNSYAAGIGLAYVLPDPTAIAAAFGIIFGA
jgi:hypothetical protein